MAPEHGPVCRLAVAGEAHTLFGDLDTDTLAKLGQVAHDARELGGGEGDPGVVLGLGDVEGVGVDVHELHVVFCNTVRVYKGVASRVSTIEQRVKARKKARREERRVKETRKRRVGHVEDVPLISGLEGGDVVVLGALEDLCEGSEVDAEGHGAVASVALEGGGGKLDADQGDVGVVHGLEDDALFVAFKVGRRRLAIEELFEGACFCEFCFEHGGGVDERDASDTKMSYAWAIQQLIELTNGEADEEVARSVLSSVDWDVQPFDIDDSHQAAVRPRQQVGRPLWTWLTLPFHLLSSIVRFIFGVLRIPLPRFATLTFYLPLSRARRGPSSSAPPKGPEAWLRQLEDETGAISVGRIRPRGSASGVASSTAASSSGAETSLTSRARAGGDEDPDTDGRKRLPDFMLSSYEDFLRACQRDTRIGCVILVSAEHDDVAEFKRSTLTDPALIKTLQDNSILVWGGDVRDREAWSAAEKLQATTYPFVGFIALQPQRGTRSSSLLSSTPPSNPSSEPTLTVLSRHQGPAVASAYYPSTPSSSAPNSTISHDQDTTPTSAPALLTHLNASLLPRVAPYLASLRSARANAQASLQRTRQLRAEQDAAFALSAARDRARIEARMAEDREERERVQREKAEEERRVREEQVRREERERREKERAAWRVWMRKAIVQPLKVPLLSTTAGLSHPQKASGPALRVAVRLPSGARIVHSFSLANDTSSSHPPTLTTLFAMVDTAFIPDAMRPADDPPLPPSSPQTPKPPSKSPESILDAHILSLLPPPSQNNNTSTSKDAESSFWAFRLLTAYPRAELPWAPATPLSAVALLNPGGGGGAQLVVELVSSAEDGHGGERRRSGESRRSGEQQRRSGEQARSSLDTGNGGGQASRDGPLRVGNSNGFTAGAGEKGKAKDAEAEKDGEDSDDGYETESSDEE
ncbi:hypothetical protein D9619_010439 [Psilocybe cf. subviscida]|uniref:UAS domain-containing protein n=1 Tax=Psilocybe cf. subviscida TaxID=2480587 RepID=A0A8H5AU73_9AGAR|nr:hypothetical protein D9619_010439 [Psilocybe cf. subviscida]